MSEVETFKRGQVQLALWGMFARTGSAPHRLDDVPRTFATRVRKFGEFGVPVSAEERPGKPGVDIEYTAYQAFELGVVCSAPRLGAVARRSPRLSLRVTGRPASVCSKGVRSLWMRRSTLGYCGRSKPRRCGRTSNTQDWTAEFDPFWTSKSGPPRSGFGGKAAIYRGMMDPAASRPCRTGSVVAQLPESGHHALRLF